MQKLKALAILNAISFVIHIGVAYLTQAKMINTKDAGEISDKYFSLFTPADFTFAIWGIIYTCLGIFCLYHIIMAYKHDKPNPANADLRSISGLFIVNNLVTAGWLIAWTSEQLLLSVVLIILQLATLVAIHVRLRIHNRLRNPGSKTCTELPLSIYLGWVSMATITNISIYLVATGWDGQGLSPVYWTMIMIGVAILAGILMIFTRKNIAFGIVIIWGLYGISSRLQSLQNDDYKNTVNIAWAGMALLALCCLIELVRGFSYKKPAPIFPEATPVK
jgi:tryptophan-rich sensory protein